MGIKRIEVTDRFAAHDADGRVYDIVETTDIIDAGSMSDPHSEITGLKGYEVSDGRKVNRIDDESFEIVGHPMILVKRIGL